MMKKKSFDKIYQLFKDDILRLIGNSMNELQIANGTQGPQGLQGEKGEKGDRGELGEPGINGEQGLKGDKGDIGLQGEQGLQGVPGIQGEEGLPGLNGDDGLQGIPGEVGPKGDKGDVGDIGAQGIKGDMGEQGIQGVPGVKGDTGNIGEQGIQGIPGNTGLKGDKGDKGDTGDTGQQGQQGIQGEPGTSNYTIKVQALTSSPADNVTIYFGMLPKAPVTSANISKVYIRKAGTIKIAEIYCYSGTAGTAEAWSLYIRKNNTADTLIATLSVNTNERVFSNTGLSISVVAGDYIEIKSVNPTWATNPLTCIFGGYIYIE